MNLKKIFLSVFLLLMIINTNILYANEYYEQSFKTDENIERVITSNIERKEVRLEINETLEKKVVEDNQNIQDKDFLKDESTSKITGFISYGSSAIIAIIFVFIFVFILNVYFTVKKKK